MIQVVPGPNKDSSDDHPTSPGIVAVPIQTMAQGKQLPDIHTSKHGQQTRQYLPATPSPLSPRSSNGRPASLPRRHTLSGPTPTSTATSDSEESAAAASIPKRRSKRHSRRHSGSLSPTERLMRYKGALAWRSATTISSPSPMSSNDISPLRRNPVQGFSPRPGVMSRANSDENVTTSTRHEEGPEHNDHQDSNTRSQSQGQLQDPDEKTGSHFVIQLEAPSVISRAQPIPVAKDTRAAGILYHHHSQPVEYPCHYQYGYGTTYTTTTHRYSPDMITSFTASSTTTTLQRAALIAASVFFIGAYILICAFSLMTARGHDHNHDHDLSIPVETPLYGYIKGNHQNNNSGVGVGEISQQQQERYPYQHQYPYRNR